MLPQDNLNTDGIYGKDYTYRDDMTREEMAGVRHGELRPGVRRQVAAAGDVIVGGVELRHRLVSREQAVTALQARASRWSSPASFSQTYLRNAFNNGFICVECPALVEAVRAAFAKLAADGQRTIPAVSWRSTCARSVAVWRGGEYPLTPLGPAAQELILAGGLEALTRSRL